jgi:hypothetical protein
LFDINIEDSTISKENDRSIYRIIKFFKQLEHKIRELQG